MSKLIPVNVLIGDRSYRLKIESDDEEMIRKTIRAINEKILEYKTSFAGKDMQDYIAMVLLWFATEKSNNGEANIKETNSIAERLVQLENILDKAFKK